MNIAPDFGLRNWLNTDGAQRRALDQDKAEHNGVKSMNMTMGKSTAGSTIKQVMVERFAATRGDAGAGKPSLSRRVVQSHTAMAASSASF